jgi:hypothetical protein
MTVKYMKETATADGYSPGINPSLSYVNPCLRTFNIQCFMRLPWYDQPPTISITNAN